MNPHRFDLLSRMLVSHSHRRRVLGGLGIGSLGAVFARGRTAWAESEAACHARCNATVPPGPGLGACHMQCGLAYLGVSQAAESSRGSTDTASASTEAASTEDECHRICNATVPPGPALGACHMQCGIAFAGVTAPETARTKTASTEEECHRICNATVPPGPALGECHRRCGMGAL